MLFARLLTLLTVLIAFPVQAGAQSAFLSDERMVEASLVTSRDTVQPGDRFHVGLRLEITDGWHTYWRNPGDSGEPTRIEWQLPDGFQAGEIVWPAPEVFPFGPLTNYGYAYEVVLPVEITVSPDVTPGFHTLTGSATWLVCEEICIPEGAAIEAYVTVGDAPEVNRRGTALIERALSQAPGGEDGPVAGLRRTGERLLLTVATPDDGVITGEIRNLRYFPYSGRLIDHSAEQAWALEAEGLAVDLQARDGTVDTGDGAGVLTFETRLDGRWQRRAIEVQPEAGARLFRPSGDAFARTAPVPFNAGTFAVSIVLAFLGGLVLNLMPCVFPVLSIKALGFVERAHADRSELRRHGLIFLGGVLAAFVGLAVTLVVLKSLGQPIGWGFQLQSPLIVGLLALLFSAIGFNLLGLFEVGTRLQSAGSRWANMDGDAGAFMTGLLAVVVAAPCIGPFAAGALSLALVQPAPVMIAVSAAMGLGLAAPYVLLSFQPGLLRRLPKPGMWMVRFKQVLAFPMFGAAIWLVWVASVQTGPTGLLWLLGAILALGFVVWSLGLNGMARRVSAVLGLLVMIAAVVMAGQARADQELTAESWSPARVAELRAEGRPVFVEFTAAWCVSCQFNKQTTLNSRTVREAFDANGVAVLVADWTNRDDTIADAIRGHGAAGVPLYVMYPADGGEPVILPPILSTSIIVDAIGAAVN
ncbi:protein-disulfide reductase DsbD family protein [Hyphobacterium marinum]|uniref:Protein-disulfide reductase DsbD domain-containing protein n=1 Tax=Hyphobacterium marinum TaxID=3116574 RepID=A0ABU7LWJ8_9PROT|nr:protein-disulfide reductase DsbD domain-containing protein [Hyphobacterium sp. Y6023]MEE2565934.1 protein-disulfide reductase DsbD domain-containing protein [Hyphobacterium sp. Y6023]